MSVRKSGVIDGFTSVQAVKHAAERRNARPDDVNTDLSANPEKKEPTPKKMADAVVMSGKIIHPGAAAVSLPIYGNQPNGQIKSGTEYVAPENISGIRTTPSRRTVICYICGYRHTVTGIMHVPYCPKCKTKLNTGDITVAEFVDGNVETIGDVVILPGAKFRKNAKITGRKIHVACDISNVGSLNFMEELTLKTGCVLPSGHLGAKRTTVVIESGQKVKIPDLNCESLRVEGHLKSSISVSEGASVTAGGFLEGRFSGPSLVVEDGAGLVAEIEVVPAQTTSEAPLKTAVPFA